MMRTNLITFLDDCLRRPRETAFAHRRGLRDHHWSYGKMRETAFQFARELESRQIGSGDRVLFWAENSAEWVAAFFGCLARGVIVVPLDVESAPEFVPPGSETGRSQIDSLQRRLIPKSRAWSLPGIRIEELGRPDRAPCERRFFYHSGSRRYCRDHLHLGHDG